jgi:hypothetical protein
MLKIAMMLLVLSMPAFAQTPPQQFKPDPAMQQAMKADQAHAAQRAAVRAAVVAQQGANK